MQDAQAPLQLHSAAGSPDLAADWDTLASVPASDAKEKGSEETAEPVPGEDECPSPEYCINISIPSRLKAHVGKGI